MEQEGARQRQKKRRRKGGDDDKEGVDDTSSAHRIDAKKRQRDEGAGVQGLSLHGGREKRAKTEVCCDSKEVESSNPPAEEEEGVDVTMQLDLSNDNNDVSDGESEGDGFFGYQLELFGEVAQSRQKRATVIQKKWRLGKRYVVGREQFAVWSGFHEVGLHRVSRQHFEIRSVTSDGTQAKGGSSSSKRRFILKDLSANGTFLNGHLLGRNQEKQLSHRDAIGVLMHPDNEHITLIGYIFTVIKSPGAGQPPGHLSAEEEEALIMAPTQPDFSSSRPPSPSSPGSPVPPPPSHPEPPAVISTSTLPPKAFRSLGKAIHYHGDNKLSYSLRVNQHSSFASTSREGVDVVLLTSKSDAPPPSVGGAPPTQSVCPTTNTPVAQELPDVPPGVSPSNRRATAAATPRFVSALFFMISLGVKAISLWVLVLSVYSYLFGA